MYWHLYKFVHELINLKTFLCALTRFICLTCFLCFEYVAFTLLIYALYIVIAAFTCFYIVSYNCGYQLINVPYVSNMICMYA